MRVVQVSDCYLPRLGGIEVQVDALAGQLRAAGHDVRVLTATPGPPLPGVVRLLPPVPLPVPVNPWAGPGLRAELSAADVVHMHLGVLAPFAAHAVGLALREGRPTVVTWHSMVGPAARALRVTGTWRRWVRAGAVPSAVGRAAADQVAGVLGPGQSVRVLPNGIDVSAWRASGPPPDEPVRVVAATRFARRKRPLDLVRTILRLRETHPDLALRATVAGDGPLLPAARRLVAVAGAEPWLDLPGRLDRPALAALYHRSHLYLSTTRLESFGLAALEARTAGLPVAGMRGSGLAEFVVDGQTGVLATDDDDLVVRAGALLADRERLATLGARLRAQPPEQSWSHVLERTLALYAEATSGEAPPGDEVTGETDRGKDAQGVGRAAGAGR